MAPLLWAASSATPLAWRPWGLALLPLQTPLQLRQHDSGLSGEHEVGQWCQLRRLQIDLDDHRSGLFGEPRQTCRGVDQ